MGIGASSGDAGALPLLTMEDVEKHNTREDAWLVLFGEAINVTSWISQHPGGEESMVAYLGKDATEDWQMIHTPGTLDKYISQLVKMGKIKRGGLWGWLLDRMNTSSASSEEMAYVGGGKATSPAADTAAQVQCDPVRWTPEHEIELPASRIFTVETLARWDGKQLPMLIGVCGLVIDVSSSDNFKPDFGYGLLWAGKDTTWAMATVSLKAADANRFEWFLEDLNELQLKSLAGWYKHFTHKYPQVGTLSEWSGPSTDFGHVEYLAEQMPTPTLASSFGTPAVDTPA